MNWALHVVHSAKKQLKRLPPKDRRFIAAAFLDMERDPFSGDIESLQGERTAWRRRVGNWRIFFDFYPERHLIVVRYIERRTSKTY